MKTTAYRPKLPYTQTYSKTGGGSPVSPGEVRTGRRRDRYHSTHRCLRTGYRLRTSSILITCGHIRNR